MSARKKTRTTTPGTTAAPGCPVVEPTAVAPVLCTDTEKALWPVPAQLPAATTTELAAAAGIAKSTTRRVLSGWAGNGAVRRDHYPDNPRVADRWSAATTTTIDGDAATEAGPGTGGSAVTALTGTAGHQARNPGQRAVKPLPVPPMSGSGIPMPQRLSRRYRCGWLRGRCGGRSRASCMIIRTVSSARTRSGRSSRVRAGPCTTRWHASLGWGPRAKPATGPRNSPSPPPDCCRCAERRTGFSPAARRVSTRLARYHFSARKDRYPS